MFIEYLKTPIPKQGKIGMNSQSVNSIVKNVKPIFNKLLFEEQIKTNPFVGIKVPFKKADKPRLTNEYFVKIDKLDLSKNSTLEVYRDIFLFLSYTGLSYCDAADLTYSDIKNGVIDLKRKKSKVQTKQFLTKQILQLIEKYKNMIPEGRILPKRSLDKMNLNLKLIGAKAGIEFPLCTYTARRFFRQSISEAGIHEELVIKTLMGHTSTNDIDSHYFYISDEILKEAKKKLQKHFKKLLK
jgi:integrase